MIQRRQFLWAIGAAAAGGTARAEGERLRVLSSVFPVHLFVRNVCKDVPGVTVELMLPAGKGCPHGYDLTPADLKRIAAAKVMVLHGAGLEEFGEKKIKAANETVQLVSAARGMTLLCEHGHEHEQHEHDDHKHDEKKPAAAPAAKKDEHKHDDHDHKHDEKKPAAKADEHKHDDHDHHHHDGNPHLASSPKRAAQMVRNLAADLAKADPAHAALYQKNGAEYAAKLDALAADLAAGVAKLGNKRIVTQHEIFDYLAKDAGLEVVGHLRSGAGAEADAKKLVQAIREKKAAAVFSEPQYDSKLAKVIAEEAGVPLGLLDPVASGPDDAALDHYEATMRKNLAALAAACGQAR